MSRIRDLAKILTASTDLSTDAEVTSSIASHAAAADPHAGYLLESLYDAKGDLIVGSADNVPSKLTSGNSGETLVADSSASTGLRYQSAYNGNGIINGGIDIWQRGTSFALTTPSTAYTADRWLGRHLGTNVTYSQQASGLTGIQYGLRVQRPNGVTGTNDQAIYYQFETADSYRFAGQTVTLSFYAKAGANFSSGSSLLTAAIYSGTGTNQNITSGAYTGQVTVANENKTLTTSYQRFSVTGTVGSTATQIAIIFASTPTGTAGANDWYEITGVQLELGSVATSFKRSAGGTLAGELAACQRYFWKQTGGHNTAYGQGQAQTTLSIFSQINLPVPLRTKTPVLGYSNLRGTDYNSSVQFSSIVIYTTTGGGGSVATNNLIVLQMTVLGPAQATQFRPYQILNDDTTAGYLQFDAEL